MKKRMLSIFLMLTLILSMITPISVLAEETTQKTDEIKESNNGNSYAGDGYEVSIKVTNQWQEAFNADVTITNTGKECIENWALQFDMPYEITNVWNGTIYSNEESTYLIKNIGSNQDIKSGENVTFGFSAKGNAEDLPREYLLLGQDRLVENEQYSITYRIDNTWDNGFHGTISISNNSSETIEDWKLEIDMPIEINNIWNGYIEKHEENHYYINNNGYNGNISPDEKIDIGFTAEGTIDKDMISNAILHKIDTKNIEISENDPLEEDYQNLHLQLYKGDTEKSITHNIILPKEGQNGSIITWESSNEQLIDSNGNITRPELLSENVELNAKLSLDDKVMIKEYVLTVIHKTDISLSDIKEFSVDDIEKLNKENEGYNLETNDNGYIEQIYGMYSNIKVNSYESALYSLYSLKTAMGLNNPFEELDVFDAEVDETGSIYKFNQVYNGLPVYDSTVVVSADEDGITDYISSDYFPINVNIPLSPSISYDESVNLVKTKYNIEDVYAEDNSKEALCILNYYGNATLTWKLYFTIYDETEQFDTGDYEILVNAMNGNIMLTNNVTSYSSNVIASGNDLLGNNRTFTVRKNTKLFSNKVKDYTLQDNSRNILIYDAGGKAENVSIFPDLFFDPIAKTSKTSWSAEEVSAMANMKDVYDFYLNTFDRISYDDAWGKATGNNIRAFLNTGIVENAFWSNARKSMFIGIGNGTTFNNISLIAAKDVLCHEFTHAIVSNETSLDKMSGGTSGAINEGYADLFSCFCDNTWQVGEEVTVNNCLRDIANPNNSGCPASVGDSFYIDIKRSLSSKTAFERDDSGGIHTNCTLISHAAYLMHNSGMKMDTLKKLWYKSLCLGYKKHSDFYDVRLKVIKAANKMKLDKANMQIINDAFDTVNIKKSNCDETYKSYYKKMDKMSFAESYFSDTRCLNGKVVEADTDTLYGNNSPIKEVSIDVYSINNNPIRSNQLTDESGNYAIFVTGESNGYCMKFQKDGFIPATMYTNDIDITNQSEQYCQTVELISNKYNGKGNASGAIISASTGKGVPNLTIYVRKGINNVYTEVLDTVTTDSNGMYSLEKYSAGNYCLELVDNNSVENETPYISTYLNIKVLGNESISNQNGIISNALSKGQLRIVLSWNDIPSDLDSHTIIQKGDNVLSHISYVDKTYYYEDMAVCVLDIDDTNGYGPETTTLYNAQTALYSFYVHNYSNDGEISQSGATVSIYNGDKSYPIYTFTAPEGKGRYWYVFKYNSATKTVTAINEIEEESFEI